MINAKEAREQTEYTLKEEDKNVLTIIENQIKTAMLQNLYSTTNMGCLSKAVINELDKLGYKTKQAMDSHNDEYYTISW